MLRKILKSGILQMLLLIGIFALCMMKIPETYTIYLSDAVIEPAQDADKVIVHAIGANMYRPNCFYVDGKRIENAQIERIDYQECFVTIDRNVLGDTAGWRRLELGFTKWGWIRMLSSPLWIEWPQS